MADNSAHGDDERKSEHWLFRWIQNARGKSKRGDIIGGEVGENVRNVVIGKNNIQIGSITIPHRFLWMIVIIATVGVVGIGYGARQVIHVAQNTGDLADKTDKLAKVISTPKPTSTPTPTPRPLDGDFNIAIAQFGEIEPNGEVKTSERTAKFTQALCNYLDSEFSNDKYGMNLDVSHRNMPTITEDSQAAELAEQINAHIVLYGAVDFNDEEKIGTFTPRFYVVDRPDMRNSEDVIGYNQLARPIRFSTEFQSEEDLKATLRTRAAILTNFTSGLVYMNTGDLSTARQSFQLAVTESENVDPFEGQEVLYLMLAYAYKLQGEYDRSLDVLEKALERNPYYARAYIGLGNNYYLMAREKMMNGQNVDAELLEKAYEAYQRARIVDGQSLGARVEEKVTIGLGNIDFIQAISEKDLSLFNRAIEQYQDIIDLFEAGGSEDAMLARLAAVAHCNIGDALEWLGDDTGAAEERLQCAEIQETFEFDISVLR